MLGVSLLNMRAAAEAAGSRSFYDCFYRDAYVPPGTGVVVRDLNTFWADPSEEVVLAVTEVPYVTPKGGGLAYPKGLESDWLRAVACDHLAASALTAGTQTCFRAGQVPGTFVAYATQPVKAGVWANATDGHDLLGWSPAVEPYLLLEKSGGRETVELLDGNSVQGERLKFPLYWHDKPPEDHGKAFWRLLRDKHPGHGARVVLVIPDDGGAAGGVFVTSERLEPSAHRLGGIPEGRYSAPRACSSPAGRGAPLPTP